MKQNHPLFLQLLAEVSVFTSHDRQVFLKEKGRRFPFLWHLKKRTPDIQAVELHVLVQRER